MADVHLDRYLGMYTIVPRYGACSIVLYSEIDHSGMVCIDWADMFAWAKGSAGTQAKGKGKP